MRIVFAGTPEVAVPTLEALVNSSHEVVAVITRPAAPQGRGRQLVDCPVAVKAKELGLPVYMPDSLKNPDAYAQLLQLEADMAAVVAYGNLIPQLLLEAWPHGWINLHFSLLPAWRGAAPVQHAIMAGDQVTGASIFQLEAGLDTGPLYASLELPIKPTDTAGELLAHLAKRGADLLVETVDQIASGQARAVAQAETGISYAPRLFPKDAQIDWTKPAQAIDQLVRGTTPAPGAWTWWQGKRLKIAPVQPVTAQILAQWGVVDVPALDTGEVYATKKAVLVGTGQGLVSLGMVAPAGKSWMEAQAWARGARLQPGQRLGQA